ncbi:MAG: DUF58 domain-containing protein [Acidimicrobiia bacterium]
MTQSWYAVALAATALVLSVGVAPLAATRRFAGALFVVAGAALLLPPGLSLTALAVLATAFSVDAVFARRHPVVRRSVSPVLSRGVPSPLELSSTTRDTVRLRQPRLPDFDLDTAEADTRLDTEIIPRRRGRHTLPAPAARVTGPLGLASWYRRAGAPAETLVYPDLPAARRLALAVRQGRFRSPGRITRGPLGLGTDFESIREYQPDDDIRQVNWRATQRTGRPMSNQYRVEQDREIICLVDCGRLMAAPLDDRTRLDAAIDAAVSVALVADELGDRCGVVAFDAVVRRHLATRRSGGDAVVRALFDLEPAEGDSEYELAFRTVGTKKRALVIVFTDLLDEAAASSLLDAVPMLARRHAVVVATVEDPDVRRFARTAPQQVGDVYATTVALDVLDTRTRVAAQLRRLGTEVIEAPPESFSAVCVAAYLRAKARARL